MIPSTLITKLQTAQHLAILTGAGISAESGIPTFRDTLTGLWQTYDASELASANGFRKDPALVWGWYEWRRMKVLKALPNTGHETIAAFAKQIEQVTLITQNVDDLHECAGSTEVIHLHGSIQEPRCFACARAYCLPEGIPEEPDGGRRIEPPRCAHCNGRIRPGVVWFGESLPDKPWQLAELACRTCDLLLIIGTSGLVWPAASLPNIASKAGLSIAQINPEVTNLNAVAGFNLVGKACVILPQLYAAAFESVVE